MSKLDKNNNTWATRLLWVVNSHREVIRQFKNAVAGDISLRHTLEYRGIDVLISEKIVYDPHIRWLTSILEDITDVNYHTDNKETIITILKELEKITHGSMQHPRIPHNMSTSPMVNIGYNVDVYVNSTLYVLAIALQGLVNDDIAWNKYIQNISKE